MASVSDRDLEMVCQPGRVWLRARCPSLYSDRTVHRASTVLFLLAVLCAAGRARVVEDQGQLRYVHDGNTTSPVRICFDLPSTHTGVVGATVAVVDPAQPSWIVTHVVRMLYA